MKKEPNQQTPEGTPGHYPWDEWETRARERGVEEELASLGRAVMREAYQHQWDRQMQVLCGWKDAGEAMLELALSAPKRARFVWEKLLAANGDQDAYHHGLDRWNPR